jgi:hypothetical protein
VFSAALGLSLAISLFFPQAAVERILFFPDDLRKDVTGEPRLVVRRSTLEGNIQQVLRELLLGPAQVQHKRVLPKRAGFRSAILREDVLYLDFSHEVLFGVDDVPLSFQAMLNAVGKTVRYNFPSVKEMVVTVNGQVPFEVPYDHEFVDVQG